MNDKQLSDILLEKKLIENKGEINGLFEKTILELESVLQIYVGDLEYCKERKYEILTNLYDIIVHINLLLLDNKTTVQNLINAEKIWQKFYHIRIFYTIAYEALEDIPQITGKDFRSILLALPNGNKYLQELNILSKALFKFKDDNNELFRKVRNVTFAHRDHDSEFQVSSILSLNWGDAIDLMLTFDPILRGYGQFMQTILLDITDKSDFRNEHLYH